MENTPTLTSLGAVSKVGRFFRRDFTRSVTRRVFCVCVFSSTVASSPIVSLKCLRVGCAKRQKRENVCVHPPLEALQFYLMSRTNVTRNFRVFHNRVVFSGGASCVIKMLSRWGREDTKTFESAQLCRNSNMPGHFIPFQAS